MSTQESRLEEIVEVFENFRKEWKAKVSNHTKMLIDLKETHLLQMGALNDRQFLVEYKSPCDFFMLLLEFRKHLISN